MSRLSFLCGLLVASSALFASGHQDVGISTGELAAVISQLPPTAPVVLVSRATHLIEAQDVIVVVTGCYIDSTDRTRSAKAHFFQRTAASWVEVFSTDEDGRLADAGAPASWEISFERLDFADADGDELAEAVICWNSASAGAFSLLQHGQIMNIVDYDAARDTFSEITGDSFLYNEFLDDTFLMNVDSDSCPEVILVRHTSLGETVMSPRPYQLIVWEVRSGELVLDPDWNAGKPLEAKGNYDLSGCGRMELVRLLLQAVECEK